MQAVLYCRVSTVEQVQNLSLSTQEKACRDYAEREGYSVVEVFVDRGESAKTTARPEFVRLLSFCRQHAGKVRAVIVYGLSRFSRNSTDHHTIAAVLRGHGVALRSVTEPIDDSPAGRFMEGICAAMAQFDNDLRSDRTKVGMRAALDRGRWVWQAPIGYRNGARGAGEPSLVPSAHAADVTAAFAAIAEGKPAPDVLARLRAVGVRGPKSLLAAQTFHRLLHNPVYCGRLRSPGFGVDRGGDWVPLVDESTWHLAQLRLDPAPTPAVRRGEREDFPLRRFAHCVACDRPLTGGWSKGRSAKYAYYHCRKGCVTAPKRTIEAAFLAYLETCRPAPSVLRLVRRDVLSGYRATIERIVSDRAKLQAHVTKLRARLRRVEDCLFDGSIDQATYTERRDELRGELAEAEQAASAAQIDTIDAEGRLAEAEYAVEHAGRLWLNATSAAQRGLLQRAFFADGVVWTGSEVLNRGKFFGIYEIDAVVGSENRGASPAGFEPASPP